MPDHLVIDRLSRLHQRMRNAVRLNQMRPQTNEHFPYDRFPSGNATGKADFQHQSPETLFSPQRHRDTEKIDFLSLS